MRIAIIGSGIAGLVCAWKLGQDHDVTLYEANGYLGGHTHTHDVEQDGRRYAVDSGFIVHNPVNYPHFTAMLDDLGVRSQPTTMSFSVHQEAGGLEYNATSLDTLFCQRRNLLSPRFLGMVRDLLRFYREAPALLAGDEPGPTLGEYLARHRYGQAFQADHLIPMASALWSSPAARILEFPARYLVRFMANHQMLQVDQRPQWRVVQGGSSRYIRALRDRWNVRVRLNCPVYQVTRQADGVTLATCEGRPRYDQVVFACHSDQALKLLAAPSAAEREVLGAITYQHNDVVLHTDARLLPRHPKAWAAWNAYVPADPSAPCSVSYCMNLLQGLQSREPFIVTLNRGDAIDPARVLARMHYHHPVHTLASVAAQARRDEISGHQRCWYAGAYWGWGFHEDGVASALDVVRGIQSQAAALSAVAA
ncbi:NAD(P)/FAD-dependent oxidoreductase [Achromobacter insuavis]|uniref:Amine oxidase n=1 Tax=Achromobacter insuavis AXX-A TaxID=1003200 RepID=F7SWW1_9BURK|nr:FAD-dependent oxidoreductase [Achromobacter insuavis]EGP47298.1 amine oxidase [Achromobacter insuavis AXX-A]